MKEQIIAELAGHGNALSAFLKVFIDFAHTHPLLMLASSALFIFACIRNDFSTRVSETRFTPMLGYPGMTINAPAPFPMGRIPAQVLKTAI